MTPAAIPHERASALVICLTFVVLVTIIVLALYTSVEMERAAASSHLNKVQAEFFALMGGDDALARLKQAAGNTNQAWISQPGRLVVSDSEGKLQEEVLLYSGETSASAPNLNVPALDGSGHLIVEPSDGAPLPLRVDWISVTNSSGLVVGRYAFWVDDESAKVNANLAWTRRAANTNASTSPTQVNLDALPGFSSESADLLHSEVTQNNYQTARFFNSPGEIRRAGGDLSILVASNKFNLTHYNHSPDSTYFNEPRIVLTTQESRAGGLPFLDILKTPNSDPGGSLTNLDAAKLTETIARLRGYLERTDWPMTSGNRSFQDKYYGGASPRLTQLALNIIDYVRSKESAQPVVTPLRGQYDGSGTFQSPGSPTVGVDAFFGVARAPMINEVAAWLSADGKQLKVKVELFLPPAYGVSSFHIPGNSLFVKVFDYFPGQNAIITEAECSQTTLTPASPYATITRVCAVNITTRPAQIYFRVAFQNASGAMDIIPLADAKLIACPVDGVAVAEADIRSIEVSDPRVNKHQGNWTIAARHSLGAQNSIYKTGDLTIRPQLDTTAGGAISDASLFMPPPRGTPGNLAGAVQSTGELGYIHTGVESTAQAGVPWRTIRLQPNAAADTADVPDWALLDVFTVPVSVPAAGSSVFRPHDDASGGKVNINAEIYPFQLSRTAPLTAVLQGARNHSANAASVVSPEQAQTLATNILSRTLAASGKPYGKEDAFDSPGEIVEIAGIADGGEESEELVRSIAAQITARSNVFCIYVIGQSLSPPDGKVTGEQRLRFIVERYLDGGEIKFRKIHSKLLTQ